MDDFYKKALLGLRTPPKEDLFASLRSIETEYSFLRARYEEDNKGANSSASMILLLDDIADRIELLKGAVEEGGCLNNKKVIFFREIAHRIDEDLLFFKNRDELRSEAGNIADNLKFTDLPAEIIENWKARIKEATDALGNLSSGCNDKASLELPRKNLRASLNHVNRSLDSNFIDLFMVKYNNVAQTLLVFVLLCYTIHIWCDHQGCFEIPACPKDPDLYIVALLGALGGAISSILTGEKQSLVKGHFIVNLFLNVLLRPIVGATSAFATALLIKSRLLFGIGSEPMSTPLFVISVSKDNIETAYQVVAFMSGFAGERWLKSTMDQLMSKLSAYASRNASPDSGPNQEIPKPSLPPQIMKDSSSTTELKPIDKVLNYVAPNPGGLIDTTKLDRVLKGTAFENLSTTMSGKKRDNLKMELEKPDYSGETLELMAKQAHD